ncbi:polysaccharide pyruvyl transferase family protein [Gaetbulibacter sp. M240]|uniref:polysaccharide pyruvyl transferase family protein n=1 Tax=Gaetbulibacter sp. M240 TaxID=3126511 RepID=UPI00374E93D5
MLNIKKFISTRFKISILLFFYNFRALKRFSLKKPKQPTKRIFIFLAADYGNLGDVAITYAQHKFLQKHFPNYLVTEIPISKTIEGISFVKKIISKDDIITIVGGGNMGDLYPLIEDFRQAVITNFPMNKIVCFPQTVDFKNNIIGEKALKKAIKVYSNHKNLILSAREKRSFDFFNTHFMKNKILLVPDIVLTLDKTKPERERKGVIVCLRNDKEKKLNKDQENTLFKIIDNNFKDKKTRDTHIGGAHLPLFNRVKALNKIWNEFKGAEMVITDRLHGMIFCYITNTPAIVFLNNNHKIQSSFYWIKNANYINLIELFSDEEIINTIKFLKTENNKRAKEDLEYRYSEFLEVIKENI